MVWFSQGYLFNGIANPYGLLNAAIYLFVDILI